LPPYVSARPQLCASNGASTHASIRDFVVVIKRLIVVRVHTRSVAPKKKLNDWLEF
jgi:hypothetical protein